MLLLLYHKSVKRSFAIAFLFVCFLLWLYVEKFYVLSHKRGTTCHLGAEGDMSCSLKGAYNVGDLGLISGLGRSPGEGKATHSSILAWRIPWTV